MEKYKILDETQDFADMSQAVRDEILRGFGVPGKLLVVRSTAMTADNHMFSKVFKEKAQEGGKDADSGR